MRIVRFRFNEEIREGRVDGDHIGPLDHGEEWNEVPLDRVNLLPPSQPTKVIAVGLNYRDHAEEMGVPVPDEPLLFMKPASSVIGHGDPIVLPNQSARVDYEAELAVVMGQSARRVAAGDAAQYIRGYTCLNDVTARDLQQKDGQWTRAKGFDTFCPLGPWLVTDVDPSDLAIELFLNGERKQKSRTSHLIFHPHELVEFISGIMTLNPGDVIATGTTSGIGPMAPGDSVEVRIEHIGSLVNPVSGGSP